MATGFNRGNGLLTDIGMTAINLVARTPAVGADTLVWLAIFVLLLFARLLDDPDHLPKCQR